MNYGFLYIAYGEKYQLEAQRSAQSLRCHMPGAKITLITHNDFQAPEFDRILKKSMQGSYLDKVRYMRESPYDKTLFLDTDTYICQDLTSLFGLLDHYDIAMAVENGRPKWKNLPASFSNMIGFNTGVILFSKNQKTDKLFRLWESVYKKRINLDAHDQISLDIALTKIFIKLGVLPQEFNVRAIEPQVLDKKVAIIHARVRNIKKTLKNLNSFLVLRAWLPAEKKCIPINGNLFYRSMAKFRPIISRIRGQGDLIMPDKNRFEK